MKNGKIYGCAATAWVVICNRPSPQHAGKGMQYSDRESAEACAAGHHRFLGCDDVTVMGETAACIQGRSHDHVDKD
jgi:hypothetical protein